MTHQDGIQIDNAASARSFSGSPKQVPLLGWVRPAPFILVSFLASAIAMRPVGFGQLGSPGGDQGVFNLLAASLAALLISTSFALLISSSFVGAFPTRSSGAKTPRNDNNKLAASPPQARTVCSRCVGRMAVEVQATVAEAA